MDGDHGRDDARQKRDQLAGELAEHGAGILVSGQLLELADAGRQLEAPPLHRFEEEMLLRLNMAQEGCGGDVQLAGDVGQRGRLETLPGEDAARRREELGPLDRRRTSHL